MKEGVVTKKAGEAGRMGWTRKRRQTGKKLQERKEEVRGYRGGKMLTGRTYFKGTNQRVRECIGYTGGKRS